MKLDIRRLESTIDIEQCVDIQMRVWGLREEETVCSPILSTCLRHGGLLIGSFSDEILTGFCFSLPSFWLGQAAHHSHMLAVLPQYRDQGIGFALKMAQFSILKKKYKFITWTFDPLESRNARLNLKLGVSIGTYIRDLYGEGDNCSLHQGIGTDRFVAEWSTSAEKKTPEKINALDDIQNSLLIKTRWDERGFFEPLQSLLNKNESRLHLEIPAEIQSIKTLDLECAKTWRSITRKTLEHYLGRGYTIRKFLTFHDSIFHSRRSFYVLTHKAAS